MKIESLENLLGTTTSGIKLSAPDNSELDVKEIVTFNFSSNVNNAVETFYIFSFKTNNNLANTSVSKIFP